MNTLVRNKILKLLAELIECESCGNTYDKRHHEFCPKCQEFN